VNFFRQEAFKANPDYRFCSAGTIARDLKKLAVENTGFQAVESGKTYQFNINDRLNGLLLKAHLTRHGQQRTACDVRLRQPVH